jgi:integrase
MLGVEHRQTKGLSAEVRDRAILLVGFASGFRRSELAGLDVNDLEGHPAGLLVRRRTSKTDQERAGRKVEIVYGADEATCPLPRARDPDRRTGPAR